MKVRGIDGKFHTFNPYNDSHPRTNPSYYHQTAKTLLKELFPYDNIYEEVYLPGTSKTNLIADFFIPSQSLLIEVHGEQHYKKGFFHKTKMDFYKSNRRDKIKQEWCNINEITLVELPYTETIDEWRERINSSKSLE